MDFFKYSYLIPLLPLAGFFINGFISFSGLKTHKRIIDITACGTLFVSLIIACGVFYNLHQLEPGARSVTVSYFTWLDVASLKADIAFLIDPLSAVMILVVTGVGFLIHVYSIGYMSDDPGYARFFSYLNLFCAAMLVLVMAANLLLMFVGWEGVGLCSYLLIGFWFDHEPNAIAGMKAFIVNRIGDLGFMIGLLLLFWSLYNAGAPTVVFTELRANAHLLGGSIATVICLLLFVGAIGKSAQIPLYVWLPDAMAGPTPVSALIHAATMVTAGVYMIGRMNFLFTMSKTALAVVAVIGGATAVFAAILGFAQKDIKRILAYSTVSQLGYMFLGMGTGMYAAGIFHLVTHAFFKACLFLGAGSVILGMHHEQEITKMGGLKKFMPITYWTFLAATLALSGIFPLAGFFSKDEILWQVFSKGMVQPLYYALWGMGLLGAAGTAFYMFRLVSLTFFGKPMSNSLSPWGEGRPARHASPCEAGGGEGEKGHREQTPVITAVLVALAILSVSGGLLGIPAALGKFIGMPNLIEGWLEPVFVGHAANIPGYMAHHSMTPEYLLMLLSLAVAVLGIALAGWLYTRRPDLIHAFVNRYKWLYKFVLDKCYVDELYQILFVNNLLRLNNLLKKFDEIVVDGFVNGTASLGVLWSAVSGWWDDMVVDGTVRGVAEATIVSGRKIRKIQTGKIQHYYYIALVGLIALLIWIVI